MPKNGTFGIAIGELRSRSEMSMSEFAEILGVSKTSVCRYESGHMKPDVEVVGRAIQFAKKRGYREIANLLLQRLSDALAAHVSELERAVGRRAA